MFGFRYSPEQLFNVVAAVDLYHDFLPWCQRSEVLRHYPDGSFDAELEIGFKFFVESYVSHVELERLKRVKVKSLPNTAINCFIYIYKKIYTFVCAANYCWTGKDEFWESFGVLLGSGVSVLESNTAEKLIFLIILASSFEMDENI